MNTHIPPLVFHVLGQVHCLHPHQAAALAAAVSGPNALEELPEPPGTVPVEQLDRMLDRATRRHQRRKKWDLLLGQRHQWALDGARTAARGMIISIYLGETNPLGDAWQQVMGPPLDLVPATETILNEIADAARSGRRDIDTNRALGWRTLALLAWYHRHLEGAFPGYASALGSVLQYTMDCPLGTNRAGAVELGDGDLDESLLPEVIGLGWWLMKAANAVYGLRLEHLLPEWQQRAEEYPLTAGEQWGLEVVAG